MTIPLTPISTTYNYPQTGDRDWGDDATNWAVDMTNGALTTNGGTRTLLADLNLGATFGIFANYFTSTTANPATAGDVRLANTDTIEWRNAANNANLPLAVGADDQLDFNGITLATQPYVDAAVAGTDLKASVVAATTTNITLSGAQTIDGISIIAGDRVLVKNQTAPAENGIYVAASGAWTRSTDADAFSELVSATVAVEKGTIGADTLWLTTNDAGGTIGVTSIVWRKTWGPDLEIQDDHGIRDENGNEQLWFQTTGSAVNYVEVTNSITGTGPVIGTAGSDSNINLVLTPKGTGAVSLTGNLKLSTSALDVTDANNNELLSFGHTGSAVNELTVTNAATGNGPELSATGGDTDIDLVLTPKGAGNVRISNENLEFTEDGKGVVDANNNELVKFTKTTSAVNELTVTNAATAGSPSITATGGDSNISLTLGAKGTGRVILNPGDLEIASGSILLDDSQGINDDSDNELVVFHKTASAVNQVGVTNAATGNGVTIASEGGDTDINLILTAKGAGVVIIDGFSMANLTKFDIQHQLDVGEDDTYTIHQYASFAYTINAAYFKTDTGTITAAVKIDGTNVTSLSALNFTSVEATATASGANTVSVGNTVTIVYSSASSAENVSIVLHCTRTT